MTSWSVLMVVGVPAYYSASMTCCLCHFFYLLFSGVYWLLVGMGGGRDSVFTEDIIFKVLAQCVWAESRNDLPFSGENEKLRL